MTAPHEDSFATALPFPAAPKRTTTGCLSYCNGCGILTECDPDGFCPSCDEAEAAKIVAAIDPATYAEGGVLGFWQAQACRYLKRNVELCAALEWGARNGLLSLDKYEDNDGTGASLARALVAAHRKSA